MTSDKPDYKLKIVVAGSGGVGKTTLVHRFLSGQFLQFSMTIGVSFQTHTVELSDGKVVKLIIWDLGGQERFRQMSVFESYCTGAHGAILAMDLTDALRTLQALDEWIKIVRSGSAGAPLVLLGTKADLKTADIASPTDLLNSFIAENNVFEYFETSSLTGQNVQEAFQSLVGKILQNMYTNDSLETAI
jgi:small GTP-binding protein